MSKKWDGLRQLLKKELHKRGCKLGDTPDGFYQDMMDKTGESYTAITSVLHYMRKKAGCRPQADKPKKRRKKTVVYKDAEKNGVVRTQPGENLKVTKEAHVELAKILLRTPDALSHVLPKDRIGIIIGTGTSFAVSPNHSKYCNKVFHDEL